MDRYKTYMLIGTYRKSGNVKRNASELETTWVNMIR